MRLHKVKNLKIQNSKLTSSMLCQHCRKKAKKTLPRNRNVFKDSTKSTSALLTFFV